MIDNWRADSYVEILEGGRVVTTHRVHDHGMHATLCHSADVSDTFLFISMSNIHFTTSINL